MSSSLFLRDAVVVIIPDRKLFLGPAGSPNPKLSEGLAKEHCEKAGSRVEFTTSNYGVTTTPEKEYRISTGQLECPAEDMVDRKGRRVRVIYRIEELEKLVLSRRAKLTMNEILAVVRKSFLPNGSFL